MTFTTKAYIDDPVTHLPIFQRIDVGGLNLVPNYSNFYVSDVLVIQGPLMERAINSAKTQGYNVKIVESFNYLDRTNLSPYEYDNVQLRSVFPGSQYTNQSWIETIRLRARLNHNQVCRLLNHMSAWIECVKISSPCIILEHDAILLNSHIEHMPRNSIHCFSTESPYFHNSGWACMGEPFAYSVDAHSANRLCNKIQKEGLVDPLELLIRLDEFMILFEKKSCRISHADSSAVTLASSA
jgi:hypothetical protein